MRRLKILFEKKLREILFLREPFKVLINLQQNRWCLKCEMRKDKQMSLEREMHSEVFGRER